MWLKKLKAESINTFTELTKQFMSHFISGQRYRRPVTYLFNIKQSKGESLRDYVTKFNKGVLQVDKANEKMMLIAFMEELFPSKFLFSLSKSSPTNMTKLMLWAQKNMNAEDTLNALRDRDTEVWSQSDKQKIEIKPPGTDQGPRLIIAFDSAK